MRVEELPLALVAFFALVAVIPAWLHYMDATALSGQGVLLAGMTMPALGLLFLVSWTKPAMAKPVMGGLVLVGVMVVAPELWQVSEFASGVLPSGSMLETVVQIALPVLILAYALGLGWRWFK